MPRYTIALSDEITKKLKAIQSESDTKTLSKIINKMVKLGIESYQSPTETELDIAQIYGSMNRTHMLLKQLLTAEVQTLELARDLLRYSGQGDISHIENVEQRIHEIREKARPFVKGLIEAN